MADRKPQARDQELDDAVDGREAAGAAGGLDDGTAKRPDDVVRNAERRDAGGDRDDEQAGNQTEDGVSKEQPEAAENELNQV